MSEQTKFIHILIAGEDTYINTDDIARITIYGNGNATLQFRSGGSTILDREELSEFLPLIGHDMPDKTKPSAEGGDAESEGAEG